MVMETQTKSNVPMSLRLLHNQLLLNVIVIYSFYRVHVSPFKIIFLAN